MSGKIEQGCLAIITESILGHSVGKIVQCVRVAGTHSLYGVVWRVRSKEELMTEYGGQGFEADVPEKWLKKIEPGDGLKSKKKELENA
jgi:hypothetical protein